MRVQRPVGSVSNARSQHKSEGRPQALTPTTHLARTVLLVQVLDLSEADALDLRERLLGCDGVFYAHVDAGSGFTEVEYRPPCTANRLLALLRADGKPVLTEFACC